MSRLPAVSARELIAALTRLGFIVDRQRGSHVVLRHPLTKKQVTVPNHPGDVKRHLVFKIVKDAGLTVDQLRQCL